VPGTGSVEAASRPPLAGWWVDGFVSSGRHDRSGYSLFSVATGVAIARLRPTGNNDKVEILWWRHDRWASIGDFGGLLMPLDQARWRTPARSAGLRHGCSRS
jgi:hypothetical protein